MSFHEKTRILSLLVTLLVWGAYFASIARDLAAGAMPESWWLWRLVPVIIVSTIVMTVSATALALWRPAEAEAGLDERERQISHQAGATAYTLLSFGLVIVIGGSLTGWSLFVTINALLFAFVLTECIRYAIELRNLRK